MSLVLAIFSIGYRLVIVASERGEEMSHFISKLNLYRRPFTLVKSDADMKKYLASKYSSPVCTSCKEITASIVDFER